ncbi:serine hydrolase domain-containing protein [Hyphococcus sp.]|uniref:serine hydrolase domain-containing protein n=1 Tax=Hyphococcus sp. TaxID=2038636 RepID=UPI00207F5A37|nr:MAG: hypothetical protein DHS20C04_17800 [Marinicaulis sp.]
MMKTPKHLYFLTTIMLAASFSLTANTAMAQGTYNWTQLDNLLSLGSGAPTQPSGGGLIITHKGQVVYRKAFGDWTNGQLDDAIPVFSVSKPISAIIALAANEDPSVSWNIYNYVDQYIPTIDQYHFEYQNITVRQTLSHISGMEADTPDTQPCLIDDTTTLSACVDAISQDALKSNPGQNFRYTGSAMQMMGLALENALGQSWHQSVDDYLSTPCDLATSDFSYFGNDNPWIAGGVIMDIDAGGEIAEVMLTGQCTDSIGQPQTVISQAALTAMRADQMDGATIMYSPYYDLRRYGYGLFRNDGLGANLGLRNLDFYSHAGAGGSYPWYDVGREYSAFLLLDEPALDVPDGIPPGYLKGEILVQLILSAIETQIDANN